MLRLLKVSDFYHLLRGEPIFIRLIHFLDQAKLFKIRNSATMCTITVELLDCQCQWLLKCLGGMQMMKDFFFEKEAAKQKGCWQKAKKKAKNNGNKNRYKNGLTFAPMLHLPFPPPTGISFLRRLGYPFLYRVYFLSLRHSYRGCCDSAKIYRRSYKRNISDQVGPRD